MQKTQLTVLIEEIDLLFEQIPLSDRQYAINDILHKVRGKAVALLPKEREDIEKAYSDGFRYARAQVSKIIKTGDHDPKEKVITEHKYFDTNYLHYKP